MNIPITQTKAWQKLQDDLGIISFFEKEAHYQYLAIRKKSLTGNYLYLPYGPVADSKEGFKDAIKSLKFLAKKENIDFIRVEPQNPEFTKLLPSKTIKSIDLNPKETWVLDLTPEKSEIIKNFSQGTRTRFNNYAKKGLRVLKTTQSSEIEHLVSLQQKLARQKNINTFSKNYLETELKQPFATLYLVEYAPSQAEIPIPANDPSPAPGQILAASLFFDHEDTRYYMQSAADGKFKKLPATVALLTEAIFDAKAKGITRFDFWGIAPEDAPKDHPWFGFTNFKKSFGGHEVHYAGTYDIVIHPARYKAYQLSRRLNRFIRH